MRNEEFLDFDDILSHHNEELTLEDFDLVEVLAVEETNDAESVYDLAVSENRNYVVSALGVVHNGGKRSGAGTVALPIWHNDVLDFLDMQTEHGDLRLKAYDVFPQICMNDVFMERDRDGLPWVTFCPFEVRKVLGINVKGMYNDDFREAYAEIERAFDQGKLKVAKRYDNARALTKIIMKVQFETGLPYISFTDTINRVNPNKYDPETEGITNVNLCTESFSNVKADTFGHVCNLASINLSNVLTMTELGQVARLSARVLDYGIELTNNPDKITADHNQKYRTIGIGMMGLHDHLAAVKKGFANLEYLKQVAECIEYNAAMESTVLAEKFGTFGNFEYSLWKTGEMVEHFKRNQTGKFDWDKLQQRINKVGIRNSQLTSPAPTTSTSIYQDCSASVLPVYSAFLVEENRQGKMPVASKFLKENPIAYGKTFSKFSAIEIIDAVAEMQKFIDTGCSMELIFDQNNPDFTAKNLYDAIHHAHVSGIKAIYYIRSIKKNEKLEVQEEACVGCAG